MTKILDGAQKLHSRLAEEADENGVWRGSLMKTAQDLGISVAVYQRIIERLKATASIEVNRHGSYSEVIVSDYRATEDARPDLTRRRRYGTLSSRMRAVEEGNIGGTNLLTELAALKERLNKIEDQLRRDSNGN